jgi:hypothetical protein
MHQVDQTINSSNSIAVAQLIRSVLMTARCGRQVGLAGRAARREHHRCRAPSASSTISGHVPDGLAMTDAEQMVWDR